MAKDGKFPSLSRFLIQVGEGALFRPASTFSSHRAEEEKAEKTGWLKGKLYGRKVKSTLASLWEQSFFAGCLHGFVLRFFTLRLRSLGVLFFSCGFLQILSYFLFSSVFGVSGREENLLFGVVLIFLTLICSFARGDVAEGLKKSFLFRGVLRPIFGIQDWQIPSGTSRDGLWGVFLSGLVLGLFSVLISPIKVIQLLLALAVTLFVFWRPEAGMVLCATLLFFLPLSLFCALTLIVAVSFLIKCAVGRRSLSFSLLDPAMLLALIPLLFAESSRAYFLFPTLFALYFCTSCLLKTLDGMHRLFYAQSLVGLFFSLSLCLRQALLFFSPTLFLRFPEAGSLLFVHPQVESGALLALLCPWTLAAARSAFSSGKRLVCLLSFVSLLGGLAVVRSSGVWLAAFVGVAVFLLFSYRFTLLGILMGGMGLITLFQVLPEEMSAKILAVFGIFNGVTVESLSPGQGLFSTLFSVAGPLGCLVLGFLLVLFVIGVYRFGANTTRADIHPLVLGALSSGASFFALGVQALSFDHRLLAFFALLCALPTAAQRACHREEVRLPY